MQRLAQNAWLSLAIILLAGLLLRLVLLKVRWINPDEGAHLMDARLFLDGFFPIVDYGARQPFYVFSLVLLMKLFKTTLTIGRLLPVFSTVGTGFMLFVLGKRLQGPTTGLIAAFVYTFLPLTLIWSVIVKTEPLTIFLACISIYFVLLATEGSVRGQTWLVLAGIFAALAFYVRQPALYLPLAITLFLIISGNGSLRETFRQLLFFALGYVAVCAAVAAVFLSKMNWQDVFFSQLDPLNLVWNRLAHLFGVIPPQYRVVDSSGFRILDQDMSYTITAWQQSIFFSLFIVIGSLMTLVRAVMPRQLYFKSRQVYAVTLMLLWAASVLLLYLFQSANRGFYTQYFTEALPSLILLASLALQRTFKITRKSPVHSFLFIGIAFSLFFFIQRIFWWRYPGIAAYLIIGLIFSVAVSFYLFDKRFSPIRFLVPFFALLIPVMVVFAIFKILHIGSLLSLTAMLIILYLSGVVLQRFVGRMPTLAESTVLLTTVIFSALYSGHIISPRYEAIWSQQTLATAAHALQQEGEAADEVLSGGTIWTFEAGMAPFLNVSHPTEFFKKRDKKFETEFLQKPPRFIIKDGYTHRKFGRYWNFIEKQLAERYEAIKTISGSRYPVVVYKLIENPFAPKTFLTGLSQHRNWPSRRNDTREIAGL